MGNRTSSGRRHGDDRRRDGSDHSLGLALCWSGIDPTVGICWALALGLAIAAAAISHAKATVAHPSRAAAISVAATTGALCAAANAINEALSPPLFSDAAGLIAGALIAAAAGAVGAVAASNDPPPPRAGGEREH